MRVLCAKRTACKMARVAPTTRPKNRKRRAIVVFGDLVVFCRLCGFLPSLWFFAVFVVFCRLCGFLASLWFFGELVVFCRLCGFLPSLWFFGDLVVFCRLCGFLATLWFFCRLCGFCRLAVGRLVPFPIFHRPILQSPSRPIDENSLEGVYFAFSLILRCLPYFCRKTRPRASCDLLEAFSSSCGECGASVGQLGRPHLPQHPAILPFRTPSTRMP